MARKIKWSPAQMVKKYDNIVSSDYSQAKPYIPSYEKEEISMWNLMSMEYQKLWFKGKHEKPKVLLAADDEEDTFLFRRYVIRNFFKKKKQMQDQEKKNSFAPKRINTIPSGTQTFREKDINKLMNKLEPNEKEKILEEAKDVLICSEVNKDQTAINKKDKS